MSQCAKHPGTERVILKTRTNQEYVGCPLCKAEKDGGRVAAPPPSVPAKKTAVKTPAKKAISMRGGSHKRAAKKAAAKSTDKPLAPSKRTETKQRSGLFSRFGFGRG